MQDMLGPCFFLFFLSLERFEPCLEHSCTFSPCGRHLPLETSGLEAETHQHFLESNPSVLASFSGQPPGTTVALSLVNEAQYLLVNTSSILELQRQLNARLDPFPQVRRQE